MGPTANMQDWANDGKEALHLRLVRPEKDVEALDDEDEKERLTATFEPDFVYPIFGEEETVYGYKDLKIKLYFASGSLAQYLDVSWARKIPDTSAVSADDVEKALYEVIPPDYQRSRATFTRVVEKDADSFRPPGERVAHYRLSDAEEEGPTVDGKSKGKGKGKASPARARTLPPRRWELLDDAREAEDEEEEETTYEVYKADWSTPGFKEYHRRMQVFLLLYIEGASYIDEEDPRWEFLTLFERRKKGSRVTYHFIGYTTFYAFFHWPSGKRLRLAQFIVLPPFQGQGHGSALYTIAYQQIVARSEVAELTVEDPSENFQDMRDKLDLRMLVESGEFESFDSMPFSKGEAEPIRQKFKLAERQFYRLLEMLRVLQLDATDSPAKEQLDAFRVGVKRRLYLFNKDVLDQAEDDERKAKLQETYESVLEDYRRLVKPFFVEA